MKIIQADVQHLPLEGSDARYRATVVVLDEGLRYTEEAFCPSPERAVRAALGTAFGKIQEALVKTIQIKHEVAF